MTLPAIEARGLGKQYHIVERRAVADTLRDEIAGGARAAWNALARRNGPVEKRPGGGLFWALRDVSFSCSPGEVIGIIGRNGSGKSTLLKILAGITEPTEGQADLRGRIGALLEVGTGFHHELSGRENVFLSGAILGMRREEIHARFEKIVAFSGVGDFIDTPVKHYSSGMHLRLAFAVASHLEPEILLVDEVLAVGDAEFQNKCLGRMDEVASAGRTVLFVSHNLAAVSRLCTRGVLLEKGRVLAEGPIRDVLRAYALLLRAGAEPEPELEGSALAIRGLEVGGSVDPEIDAGDAFVVSFLLRIGQDFGRLRVILTLRDAEEQVVVAVSADSGDPGVPTSRGTHRVSVRVPPLWLAPGGYGLQVKAVVDERGRKLRAVSEPMMVSIHGSHVRDHAAPGFIRPLCEWGSAAAEAGTR